MDIQKSRVVLGYHSFWWAILDFPAGRDPPYLNIL